METLLVNINGDVKRKLTAHDLDFALPRDVLVWINFEAQRRECPQWQILKRLVAGFDEQLFVSPERFCASVIESFRFRSRFPYEKNLNILRYEYSNGTLKMMTDSVYYILVECINPFWGERTSCTVDEFNDWKKENEKWYGWY
jgi:hypothetical protein